MEFGADYVAHTFEEVQLAALRLYSTAAASLETLLPEAERHFERGGAFLVSSKLPVAFIFAHGLSACIALRQKGAFRGCSILLSLVLSMLAMVGGSLWVSLLLHKPFTALLSDALLARLFWCWLMVNFCPFDLCYRLLTVKPLLLIVSSMEGLFSAKKVIDEVLHATKVAPASFAFAALYATLSACGGGITCSFFLKFCGNSSLASELTNTSWKVKACAISSIFLLMTLDHGIGSELRQHFATAFGIDGLTAGPLLSLNVAAMCVAIFVVGNALLVVLLGSLSSPFPFNLLQYSFHGNSEPSSQSLERSRYIIEKKKVQ